MIVSMETSEYVARLERLNARQSVEIDALKERLTPFLRAEEAAKAAAQSEQPEPVKLRAKRRLKAVTEAPSDEAPPESDEGPPAA